MLCSPAVHPSIPISLLTALPLVTVARASIAQDRPASRDEAARYSFILDSLEQQRPAMQLWWTGWTIGYAGLSVGQAGAALTFLDEQLRTEATVGAIESSLGVIGMFIAPRSVLGASDELRAMDASTPAARTARLRRAEARLADAADDEALATSWVPHLEAVLVNTTGTSVLWFGYHRYAGGWLNLVAGTAIAELQIVTRPTGTVDALRRYRAGAVSSSSRAGGVAWTIAPALGGASVIGTF